MIKIKVGEETWRVFLKPTEEFEVEHPGDVAVTLPTEKHIVFSKDYLTEETVAHELWHAGLSLTFVNATELTGEQMEEVSAEMFAKRGRKLLDQSRTLYKRLKRMQ
jgi:hypothetical protein